MSPDLVGKPLAGQPRATITLDCITRYCHIHLLGIIPTGYTSYGERAQYLEPATIGIKKFGWHIVVLEILVSSSWVTTIDLH